MAKLQKQCHLAPIEGCVERLRGGIAWLWSAILSASRRLTRQDETACLPSAV